MGDERYQHGSEEKNPEGPQRKYTPSRKSEEFFRLMARKLKEIAKKQKNKKKPEPPERKRRI